MSVRVLTDSSCKHQVWINLYMNKINTKDADIDNIFARDANINNIKVDTLEVKNLIVNDLSNQFDDNIIALIPFGGSINNTDQYFKYNTSANSCSTNNPDDYDAGFYVPVTGKIK